jgi:hypothetical protein
MASSPDILAIGDPLRIGAGRRLSTGPKGWGWPAMGQSITDN